MPEIVLARQGDRQLSVSPLPQMTVQPGQIGQLLRRSLPMIIAFGFVFGLLAYLGAAFLLPKRYTTTGIITVETESFAIPELEGAMKGEAMPDPMPLVRSEVQVLQSPSLTREVVQDLNLVQNPEFNPTLRPKSIFKRAELWVQNELPPSIRAEGESIGIFPKPKPAMSPKATEDLVVGAVLHNLSIINDNRSLVIDVQFTANSPTVASAVVNSLMKHYLDNKAEARDKTNKEANSTLTNRVKQVHDEIAAIEDKMQKLREKHDIVQMRAGSVGQQQLEDLSAALAKATADRVQLEATAKHVTAIESGGAVSQDDADAIGSNTLSALREREAEAERHLAQLSATFGPGHPARRAAAAQVASAHAAIASEVRRDVRGLHARLLAARQRESDLQQQLNLAQSKASNLAAVQGQLGQLEKDADARRALYKTLLQRAEQTDKESLTQTSARVVSPADVPVFPSSPRPKLAGALGAIGGFAFGGFLGMLRKRDDEPFSAPDEVADETGLAALATVPRISGRTRNRNLPATVLTAPAGPEAEAVRLLRTRLRFVGRGAVPQSLLFISAASGEGATSLAAAFARLAALDGLRVLLIEGDLQNPAMSRMLDLPPSNGIVETLLGHEHWREATVRDPHSTLECLVASGTTQSPGHLLETMQLQNLVAEARDEFNLIVVDSHPLSAATHGLVLAHVVDEVILVVAPGETSRQNIHGAAAALLRAARRAPVIAVNKA